MKFVALIEMVANAGLTTILMIKISQFCFSLYFTEEVMLNEERTTDEDKIKIMEGTTVSSYEKKVWTVMADNSTDINKTNGHFSSELTEHNTIP